MNQVMSRQVHLALFYDAQLDIGGYGRMPFIDRMNGRSVAAGDLQMNDVQNDLSGIPLTALLAELLKRTTALLAELLKRTTALLAEFLKWTTANPRLFALYYLLPAAPTLGYQISVRAEQCVGRTLVSSATPRVSSSRSCGRYIGSFMSPGSEIATEDSANDHHSTRQVSGKARRQSIQGRGRALHQMPRLRRLDRLP